MKQMMYKKVKTARNRINHLLYRKVLILSGHCMKYAVKNKLPKGTCK